MLLCKFCRIQALTAVVKDRFPINRRDHESFKPWLFHLSFELAYSIDVSLQREITWEFCLHRELRVLLKIINKQMVLQTLNPSFLLIKYFTKRLIKKIAQFHTWIWYSARLTAVDWRQALTRECVLLTDLNSSNSCSGELMLVVFINKISSFTCTIPSAPQQIQWHGKHHSPELLKFPYWHSTTKPSHLFTDFRTSFYCVYGNYGFNAGSAIIGNYKRVKLHFGCDLLVTFTSFFF